MARFKTFANSGTLLATDLNSVQDDYERLFSIQKQVQASRVGSPTQVQVTGAATFMVGSGLQPLAPIYLDPADYAAGARTVKLRLRVWVVTNAVAPAINFAFALQLITGTSSAAGSPITTITYAAAISGSSVAINAPGASSFNQAASSAFNFPAAGVYAITVASSGAPAAGATFNCHGRLEVTQV